MKKEIIAIVITVVILGVLVIFLGINKGETRVDFEKVAEKAMPREIEADIIPEYRNLERALACKVNDSIYVIATRGEKPTSGYEIKIKKITMETKDKKNCLIVYADFTDPVEPENMAQILTYPCAVVKTDLKGLPDKIELRGKYIDQKLEKK